ncbi:glycine cleavage system protein GcvH [Chitinophaga horti]|uniref:Glycine cleavage system H protein n=1 Tax=Chitinophaga horti TaxID=2920382 RepID=A0ABY6IXR5_9BACT|nr:glycine cleavage system protein GcvH [Chitinophaga horti]UYQ92178.1 glycine cleavage system protein GcvH [Chitinophaga horti]
MNFPDHLKYSAEHTWLSVAVNIGIVGITDFAQNELGEIVFVDLPAVGETFDADEVFGSVEAIKTVSDLFMPVAVTVTEINPALKDNPGLLNDDPFGEGWLIKVQITGNTDSLLSSGEYQVRTGS